MSLTPKLINNDNSFSFEDSRGLISYNGKNEWGTIAGFLDDYHNHPGVKRKLDYFIKATKDTNWEIMIGRNNIPKEHKQRLIEVFDSMIGIEGEDRFKQSRTYKEELAIFLDYADKKANYLKHKRKALQEDG